MEQHYAWALRLHEHTCEQEKVAAWIEPFLRGTLPMPVEMAVKEAIAQGLLDGKQVEADCRTALAVLVHPMQRSRLLRMIGDLGLVQLVPEIEPLLHAQAADERAAAIRTLARLRVEQAAELIHPLLQDVVYDVRKAAQTAVRNLSDTSPRQQRPIPIRLADGTRSWTVGETSETAVEDDDSEWKARLRSMMNE
jgi:HEAT repeat protein